MINKVILLGNLGKDPDNRTTAGGMQVASFSVATTSSRKINDKWETETEWHNVTVFGKMAENCIKYLAKGSKVFIEGKLKTDKYPDKNGVEKYSTKIIANEVKFLTKKEQSEQLQYDNVEMKNNPVSAIDEDDIPF